MHTILRSCFMKGLFQLPHQSQAGNMENYNCHYNMTISYVAK